MFSRPRCIFFLSKALETHESLRKSQKTLENDLRNLRFLWQQVLLYVLLTFYADILHYKLS